MACAYAAAKEFRDFELLELRAEDVGWQIELFQSEAPLGQPVTLSGIERFDHQVMALLVEVGAEDSVERAVAAARKARPPSSGVVTRRGMVAARCSLTPTR